MKNNYVLIDYENVQPTNLSLLEDFDVEVFIFVGQHQEKIPFKIASAVQALGDKAQYIKISGNGRNALDFHIAFYMGKIAERDPNAYFHVISKDTGFDPLVKHLRQNKIYARRENDIAEIPLLNQANLFLMDKRMKLLVERLIAMGHAKPRRQSTLINTINTIFEGKLEHHELTELVEQLSIRKLIRFVESKVDYLPPLIQS
ncbi:hypothetical protein AltI4_16150 [Alteromonas sp. I4]|nr:hypothetical protein AltI4_16150 [Alteromonas sp. I4]